jgi:hypothetical protein
MPRGSSGPVVGEQLYFELGRGKGGKIQAVKAHRKGEGVPASHSRPSRRRPGKSKAWSAVISVLFLAGLGVYAYQAYRRGELANTPPDLSSEAQAVAAPGKSSRCDGRRHCSQMTSCAEAKYFINNCPGMAMDGDNDGIPCEQELCGH